MGCLVVLLAFISPRLALFAIFLFSDLLSDAFDSWFVPLTNAKVTDLADGRVEERAFVVLSKRHIRVAYPVER
jgi:hypothetical protein